MKQIWLGLTACALIATSCAKNEIAEINQANPNVIGFVASTGKTGKALTNDLTALQASAGFGVYGTKFNGTTQAEYVNNGVYAWATSKWAWTSGTQNWPTELTDYPMNFYASYPIQTLSAAGLTKVITIADAMANQVDHLAAKQTAVSRPANSLVSLDFKHMLSKIDFKIVAGKGTKVYVQSIEVVNFGETGTFSYGTMAWTVAPATFAKDYRYSFASTGQVFAGEDSETTAQAVAPVAGANHSLMLMPQDATARGWNKTVAGLSTQAALVVVYRIEDATSGGDIVGFAKAKNHPGFTGSSYDGEKALFVKVAYALPANWAAATAYTYTIFLGTAGAGNGTSVEDDFIGEDGDGDTTDLPVVDPGTGEEIDPEDPITPTTSPIGFTVSVTEWGTPTNTDVKQN